MPDHDLPRYTWSSSGASVDIYRRNGIYGQDRLFTVGVPILQIGSKEGKEAAGLLPEVANMICEYLDGRERERNEC